MFGLPQLRWANRVFVLRVLNWCHRVDRCHRVVDLLIEKKDLDYFQVLFYSITINS